MTTTSHDTDRLSVTDDRTAWQPKQVDESAAPDAFTEFELVHRKSPAAARINVDIRVARRTEMEP